MRVLHNKLSGSYRYCRCIARKRARNFYYAFMVLPRVKSDAMCAVYAFMRYCDDIADEDSLDGDRGLMLERWRGSLDDATRGICDGSRILPAFADTLKRFDIPAEYFHQLIDGAEMDLSVDRYATFDDLYEYCYRVASVVGLVCISIFGYDAPIARRFAEYCGIAFQLTNILRDIREDADRGRIYIPEEDLWAFGYSAEELITGVTDERFLRLIRFEAQRAQDYYDAARNLVPLVHGSGRPGLCAMIEIYSSILQRIKEQPFEVLEHRISLSGTRKLGIAGRALVMSRFYGGRPYLPELQS